MVWDAEGGSKVGQLDGHAGEVTGVAWSQSGERLISASTDKTVMVWNAESESISADGTVAVPEVGTQPVAVSEVETQTAAVLEVVAEAGLGDGETIEPRLGGAEESQLGLEAGGVVGPGPAIVGGAGTSQLEVRSVGGVEEESGLGQLGDSERWFGGGASSYGDLLRKLYQDAASLEYELEMCFLCADQG